MKYASVFQNYTLTAKIKDEKFEQSVVIINLGKQYSAIIQTDKPIYKPGDVIMFRVLMINSEKKPYQVYEMRIEFRDGHDEIVRLFRVKEDEIRSSVYIGHVSISNEPVMGNWSIRVITNHEDDFVTTYKFEVKQYSLPRFEVTVDTENDISHDDGTVTMNVKAVYTFGEYVTGTSIISANVYSSNSPDKLIHAFSKLVNIDSFNMIEFDLKRDLKVLNADEKYKIKFNVTFTETLTGQSLTKIETVRVHKSDEVIIKLITSSAYFKPGRPFKVTAMVKDFKGHLIYSSDTVKFLLKHSYKAPKCPSDRGIDTQKLIQKEIKLQNSRAEFEFSLPSNTSAITISAQLRNAKAVMNVTRLLSNSEEFLSAKVSTKM